RYHYYVCAGAQKRGWQSCPAPSIPAGTIEQLVVDEIGQRHPAGDFASMWQALPPAEQTRLVHRLGERSDHDGVQGRGTMTLHSDGGSVFAQERVQGQPEPKA